jgi:tricorn protease
VVAPGYLRFPHINRDLVTFVAADDVWLAPAGGGRAWRFTADEASAETPRFSADGTRLAWTCTKDGGPEVYQASLAEGAATRLTYWGTAWARVCGWTLAGEVLAVSAAGQPRGHYPWARALATPESDPALGAGAERLLPLGPVADLSVGDLPNGGTGVAVLNGTFGSFQADLAFWKRYRGGTAGRLWIGPVSAVLSQADQHEPAPGQPFRRLLADLPGGFASPMMVGSRVAFLSDHQGTGNIYSCALDGTDLRRHTDHDGWYARQASTDGQRVIYACGGELWLLADLDQADPVRLDILLGSPASGRAPRLISADDHVGSLSVDKAGTASAVEVRGTVHWLTHRDGPARALAAEPGARARYPQVLGDDGLVVWATDAGGADALEIGGDPRASSGPAGGSEESAGSAPAGTSDSASGAGPAAAPRRLAAGQVGRVNGLAAAPDGSAVAVAAQDGRLIVVEVASGGVRELAASGNGRVTGMAWSPDSAWLAWSEPADQPGGMGGLALRRLRLARIAGDEVTDITDGRFTDSDPVFSHDGKYLAFLSRRSFDPVYDAHVFDLSFPYGARPFLLPLQASAPSPFGPLLGGRPIGTADADSGGHSGNPAGAEGSGDGTGQPEPPVTTVPPVSIDIEGIGDRIVALPVPEARYSRLRAVKGGLAWLREPVTGNLGIGGAELTDDAPRPVLERFDFGRREAEELRGDVDWFEASKDGTRLVVSDHGKLTVIPGARKAGNDDPDDRVRIDGSRARFMADPSALWRQAYAEAFRIMRHDFWVADMADVDWDAIQDEYRSLLERITSPAEFADVLWEVFGELGTSHAYVHSPPGESGGGGGSAAAGNRPGLLGADLERTADGWRVTRIVRGESSDPRARSPLAAPGVAVAAGDMLLAVDGRPVGPDGPGPLLSGAAGKPVELTLAPAAEAGSGSAPGRPPRRVVVVPLGDDMRLRYQDWVSRKRAEVRELGDGRVGYLHVPDMVSEGWADFHRDLRSEMIRDALIIDVRGNTGGHTSQLVVEKLARRVIAWDVSRGLLPSTYPEDAPRGPLVAIADECAGSDGDIVTAAIRILGLGPVVGARTWGGVIGYDDEHELVDGTQMTVPRLAFWMNGFGWGIENYGVDPDVEVIPTPDDWAAGRDVQLETAVRLALEALQERPAVRPPDPAERPTRRRPPLPPRSG